jgi:hypothetical protein
VLKYFPNILRGRRKNEEYAERKFCLQPYLETLKRQFFEKLNGELYSCLRVNSLQIYILDIFRKKMLYAYTEKTLNGKLNPKSEYISVNNNTKF